MKKTVACWGGGVIAIVVLMQFQGMHAARLTDTLRTLYLFGFRVYKDEIVQCT